MSNVEVDDYTFKKLEKEARQIILKHTGETRSVTGLRNNNWVFLAREKKPYYLVKFVPLAEKKRLEVEVAAYDYLRENTVVPVPDTISFEVLPDIGACTLRKIVIGRDLESYITGEARGDQVKIRDIFRQAGETLAELHSLEFSRKGLIEPDLGVQEYDIFSCQEYRGFIEVLRRHKVISAQQFKILNSIDIDYYFSGRKNVLCHCDYAPKNILVTDDRISAVIDFEWASACPFMDDAASFDLFVELLGPDYPIEEFYRGYNSRKKLPESFFQDLDFYKFYRLATMVSYQLKVEGERIAEERFQGMQQKLQDSLGELEKFKSYREGN